MELLLDTHALIWWVEGSSRLPEKARAAIANPESDVYVSAVNAWEIFSKHRLGKLPEMDELLRDFPGHIRSGNFLELPLTISHAARAGHMQGEHRDPFDRMLMAQALEEDLTLVSNETAFDRFGVKRLW